MVERETVANVYDYLKFAKLNSNQIKILMTKSS